MAQIHSNDLEASLFSSTARSPTSLTVCKSPVALLPSSLSTLWCAFFLCLFFFSDVEISQPLSQPTPAQFSSASCLAPERPVLAEAAGPERQATLCNVLPGDPCTARAQRGPACLTTSGAFPGK